MYRQALGSPRPESSYHVGAPVQPEPAQRVCGEAGGVTLGTQHDYLDIIAGGLGQSGRALRVKAPLQVVTLDWQGAGNLPLPCTLPAWTNVHQQSTSSKGSMCLCGGEARQSRAGLRQHLIDTDGISWSTHQSTPAFSTLRWRSP